MAAYIYIDRTDDHRISVRVKTGARGDKTRYFAEFDREAAELFAKSKMQRQGCIHSTLDMSPEQLANYRAREAKTREQIAALGPIRSI